MRTTAEAIDAPAVERLIHIDIDATEKSKARFYETTRRDRCRMTRPRLSEALLGKPCRPARGRAAVGAEAEVSSDPRTPSACLTTPVPLNYSAVCCSALRDGHGARCDSCATT